MISDSLSRDFKKEDARMRQLNFQQVAIGMVLAVCCMLVGSNVLTTNQAQGEVRGTAEPPTFQAGSVPVLRDISSTLRQIDSRLVRLEAIAQKMQAQAAASAQRAVSGQAAEQSTN
jgi:hypothetical protein